MKNKYMTLAFMGLGAPELIIVLVYIFLIAAIGNYGKCTAFGYYGSILLSILTTPLGAFIIIRIAKYRKAV